MPLWPDTLPAAPLLEGFQEVAPETALRTAMEQGPAKLRQRTTAGLRQLAMSYLLTKVQVAAIESFYRTTLKGGTLSFDYTHPRLGTNVTCRFLMPPEYAAVNGNYFKVGVMLEVLP